MLRLLFKKNNNITPKKGFAAIVSVLILGAISVSVAVAVLLYTVDNVRNSADFRESTRARVYADTCAEIALENYRQSSAYNGEQVVDFENGSCKISEFAVEGSETVFYTSGNVDGFRRNYRISIESRSPQIQISSWSEVSEVN